MDLCQSAATNAEDETRPTQTTRPPRSSPSGRQKQWFRALKKSGQAAFYQDSDWQEARIVAYLITKEMNRDTGPRAGMMDVIFSRADNLMTTEGARRRLRVELHAAQEQDNSKEATVSMIDQYRSELA